MKGFPANGPDPRGKTEMRGLRSCSLFKSLMKKATWDRRKCDQRMGCARCPEVQLGHRPRELMVTHLEVGVPRHNMVDLCLCTGHENPNHILQEVLELLHLLQQPDAHVRRNLIIS